MVVGGEGGARIGELRRENWLKKPERGGKIPTPEVFGTLLSDDRFGGAMQGSKVSKKSLKKTSLLNRGKRGGEKEGDLKTQEGTGALRWEKSRPKKKASGCGRKFPKGISGSDARG